MRKGIGKRKGLGVHNSAEGDAATIMIGRIISHMRQRKIIV